MPVTISQKIIFKNVKPSTLYSMFLDSRHHSKLTGNNPAKTSAKEGAKFFAYGGHCFGKNLQLVKDKLIVQSWREDGWNKSVLDSTFILSFEQKKNDTLLTMVHANVPNNRAKGIKEGWTEYYWTPWKKYLSEL